MRTVGQIFQDERFKKGFTLEQIEKATKIRAKFLTALEKENFNEMPALPYIQGFIRNYSEFLGLRSETMLALFRRQYMRREVEKKQPLEEPLTSSSWQMTPNKVVVGLVILLIVSLFSYFYHQYNLLHRPPPLLVENPKDEVVSKNETVAVFGKTDPDATLTINNEPILIKEDGKFYKDINLSIGNNTLVIEATSRIGEKTSITRRITRSPD